MPALRVHVGGPRVEVLKFGSSVLSSPGGFAGAAQSVARFVREGRRFVVVVSAIPGTTDRLVAWADALGGSPRAELVAALLRTGEEASTAAFAIALEGCGVSARALSAVELGIRTAGPLHDGTPYDVDVERLLASLSEVPVVVVPGFVGSDREGLPSVLGRGGSDLTALFVGAFLGAESICLVKDVPGVLPRGPGRRLGGCPLPAISWSTAERIGNGVVQTKALRFAQQADLTFRVSDLRGPGTLIGPSDDVSALVRLGVRQ